MTAKLVLTVLALVVASPALADNYKDCERLNTYQSIKGCSAIIKKGRETKKKLSIVYFNRGNAYSRKNNFDLAIADFDKAISLDPNFSLDPNYGKYYLARGTAYENKGQIELALADFQNAASHDPFSRWNGEAMKRIAEIKKKIAGGISPIEIAQVYPIPKPRPKPLEILVMAAASNDISDLNIEPTSVPPPTQVLKSKPSVITDNPGVVEAAETLLEHQTLTQMSNPSAKGSFADAVRDGTAEGAPLVKPQMASFDDINWWPVQTLSDPEQAKVGLTEKIPVQPQVPHVEFGSRIALVIGNSVYQHVSPLDNPVNDAELMTTTLKKAGFKVTKLIDADQNTMKKAMLAFGRELRGGADASLFYYSGHGVQVKAVNYLIPVDASIKDEDEVEFGAIDVNAFLQTMDNSPSKVKIVVLDACRDNPFANQIRGISRGLASVIAPSGTFIAYSTAPGSVAEDGDGRNSPYTASLAESILRPGITIEATFKQARVKVLKLSSHNQIPWESSSLTGDFFFIPEPPSSPKKHIYDRIIGTNEILADQPAP